MALIHCPECQKEVSSLASVCIHCGYPLSQANNSTIITNEAPYEAKRAVKRANKRPMRRANGTGSIRYLGKNRRNPYAAYPPITDYHDSGTAVLPKAIGYYPTYNLALDALNEYTKNPYDLDTRGITFAEVHDRFIKFKFEDSKKEYSKSLKATLESAYKHCKMLYDMPFASIRTDAYQKVLDDCELKRSSVEHILSLLHQLAEYAIQMGITDKDFTQYAHISIPDDDENGEPFFTDELKALWKDKDNEITQKILIMIYSGFRISEFETIKINLEEQYFQGGMKTKAGKNRIVPIHPCISSFISEDTFKGFKAKTFRNVMDTKLIALGLNISHGHKKHTPHDCRHTFSWLCDFYKVDDFAKHLMLGHSIQGDVEAKIYNHRTLEQLKSEISKIQADI